MLTTLLTDLQTKAGVHGRFGLAREPSYRLAVEETPDPAWANSHGRLAWSLSRTRDDRLGPGSCWFPWAARDWLYRRHWEVRMEDVDAFLSSALPLVKDDVEGIHSGNVAPRIALWSHHEPVTIFGAAAMALGWNEIETGSQKLAANFHGSESCEYEVLAAGVSGDLAYIAGIEHLSLIHI